MDSDSLTFLAEWDAATPSRRVEWAGSLALPRVNLLLGKLGLHATGTEGRRRSRLEGALHALQTAAEVDAECDVEGPEPAEGNPLVVTAGARATHAPEGPGDLTVAPAADAGHAVHASGDSESLAVVLAALGALQTEVRAARQESADLQTEVRAARQESADRRASEGRRASDDRRVFEDRLATFEAGITSRFGGLLGEMRREFSDFREEVARELEHVDCATSPVRSERDEVPSAMGWGISGGAYREGQAAGGPR